MSAAASHPRTGQISLPRTGQIAVPVVDSSRRPDVLLRRRTPEGHQVNAWWMIGAFVGVSLAVVGLLNFFPGGY
ncbi:UDP-N-acetylmuramyl pentapeptide phosphotransferase [Microbacterium sp. bgisy203]|uniref:UDP-N-acetylmuramyl pentapeptide phosphotransferase n=1 Tax=Microbacterium sp. bgisy203 TaxID=3413799 RepID=UPI003D736312